MGPTPSPTRVVFLDFLRGPAALLVVWGHLVGSWLDRNNEHWIWLDRVRNWINKPLGLIQDFGWLGVCLFFLISGFIITHVATREQPLQFLLNRIFRIFPPLIVSILLIGLLGGLVNARSYSLTEIVLASTLLGYFRDPQVIVNAGAWTLAVEVLFYALTLAGFRMLGRPARWVAIELVAVALVIYFARSAGSNFFLFAASVCYLPYLFLGQLLYYVLWQKSLHVFAFSALFGASMALLIYGMKTIHVQFLPIENSYLVTLFVALTIFVIALGLNARLAENRVMLVLANWSYAIYLFHPIVGRLVIDRLAGLLGYQVSLGIGLIAVAIVSEASLRWIEAPSRAFARKLWRVASSSHDRRFV